MTTPTVPAPYSYDTVTASFSSTTGLDSRLAELTVEESGFVGRSSASFDRFGEIEPGASVPEPMSEADYQHFRGNGRDPKSRSTLLRQAEAAYRFNGVPRWVVDMMADFVCQGIEIYHPARSKQDRYRHWWKKVRGREVSERLANTLYRHAASCVYRNYSHLNPRDIEDLELGTAEDARASAEAFAGDRGWLYAALEADIPYKRSVEPGRWTIPAQYVFLDPATVEPIGGDLAAFAATPANPVRYGVRIPEAIRGQIQSPKSEAEKQIVRTLPEWVRRAAGKKGSGLVPLDPAKFGVVHYKKDDWRPWADPLLTSVMDDIQLLQKMKRADRAALDSAIRQINLWLLGDLDKGIAPGPGEIRKLRDQLLKARSSGGGQLDLIWPAWLKLQQGKVDVAVLDAAKYEPVLRRIYSGLGVPMSMGGGKSGGMTSDGLNLKTLIERLQYVRNAIVDFWAAEFEMVRRAFGDRKPAMLRFESMSLSDEAAIAKIWMDLWDRRIISDETLREKFGELDPVERARIEAETKDRGAGKIPPKLGPFVQPEPNPDQFGLQEKQLTLQEKKDASDRKLAEKQQAIDERQGGDLHAQKLAQNDEIHKQRLAMKAKGPSRPGSAAKPKGQSGQGRPKGAGDAGPRKKRTPKVAASLVGLQAEARAFQRAIAEAVAPDWLEGMGKANLRQLTAEEAAGLEELKFRVLCRAVPGSDPDFRALASGPPDASEGEIRGIYEGLLASVYGTRRPTAEEVRDLRAAAYAAYHARDDDEEA